MTRFMKLTNMVLNTKDIHKIMIQPHKYSIHVSSNKLTGITWSIYGSGFGTLSSSDYKIEVCETERPEDYKLISEWIAKQDEISLS